MKMIASNCEQANFWHVAAEVLSRGERTGIVMSVYHRPACGAKIGGSYGTTVRGDIDPAKNKVCPTCAKRFL
jgi:hypothetical protein